MARGIKTIEIRISRISIRPKWNLINSAKLPRVVIGTISSIAARTFEMITFLPLIGKVLSRLKVLPSSEIEVAVINVMRLVKATSAKFMLGKKDRISSGVNGKFSVDEVRLATNSSDLKQTAPIATRKSTNPIAVLERRTGVSKYLMISFLIRAKV